MSMITCIIFDWKRTLYNPDTKKLIIGAKEILGYLKEKNIPLVLIGKGGDDMQEEVKRLGVQDFFTSILFTEEKKDTEFFTPFVSKHNPQSTLFIGDRMQSEIAIGNKLGCTTMWIKQGKFAKEKVNAQTGNPSYIADSLVSCLGKIKKLVN